jgi:hypothetical protein
MGLLASTSDACVRAATVPKLPQAAPGPGAGGAAVTGTAGWTAPREPDAAPSIAAPPLGPLPVPASVPKFLSANVAERNDPAWAFCHRAFRPAAKDVSKDVLAMATGCAKATNMHLVGKTILGKENDSESPQSYALKAQANHCYRVYAQAEGAIKDFDVAIKDSTGAILDQHSNDAGAAVVTDDGAVCFKDDDAATVVVSVGMGGGVYAVQIWGD